MSAPPPFNEARGCKEWLNSLPLTNIPQAQSMVLEALRALNASGFEGLERLKCLELMRDKASFLQGEQRSRYFGKTLPLSPNDANAWMNGRTLLQEMEAGYRRCLEEAFPGGVLAAHAGLVTQRIVRYLGAQMLFHGIVYRRFEPALWTRLHEAYAQAERAGIEGEAIKDSLEGEGGTSSVAEAYAHVVLFQAACPAELSAPQMDFVESLLRPWARRVAIRPSPPQGAESLPLVVDLARELGARPLVPGELAATHRVLDVEQVSRSLRKRIHGLEKDEDPATLGIPAAPGGVDVLSQMRRLHRLWCEGAPPRPASKASKETVVGLAFGMAEAWFFLSGGKVFEQPDKKRELTRQEKNDIEVFGRVTERTQSMMVSDISVTLEPWTVVEELLGAWRLQRPSTASKGIAIGRIAALRAGATGPFFLAMVSAIVQETDGRLVATLTLFPGRPEGVPVRAADARNRANAQWSPGFSLPPLERINVPASLVVPANVAARGRGVEAWEGAPKEKTVYEILERGSDFDRITTF